MNSEDFTDKYFNDIVGSRLEYFKCVKKKDEYEKYQKNNFKLISNLVDDLFNHKNSRDSFQTISNLVIVTLNSREPSSPIDIFSSSSTEKRGDSKHKEALRKELIDPRKDPNNTLEIEQRVRDIFSRFLERYDKIENFEFGPRLKKNGNGFPN